MAWRFPWLTSAALAALVVCAAVCALAPAAVIARAPMSLACAIAAARPGVARGALLARLRRHDEEAVAGFARWWRGARPDQRAALAPTVLEATRLSLAPDLDLPMDGFFVAQDAESLVLAGLVAADTDAAISADGRRELAALLCERDDRAIPCSCAGCGIDDDEIIDGLWRVTREERLRVAPTVAESFEQLSLFYELPAFRSFLRRCIHEETDPTRRRAILTTLGDAGDRFVGDEVWEAWVHGDLPPDVIDLWLMLVRDPSDPSTLARMLRDPRSDVRMAAAAAATRLRDPRNLDDLVPLLADADQRIRGCALVAIAQLDDARALSALARVAAEDDAMMRLLAVDAAGLLRGDGPQGLLAARLDDASGLVAAAAARELDRRGD